MLKVCRCFVYKHFIFKIKFHWKGNRAAFGAAGAVAPLVSYLTSEDLEVHRTTSVALYQLSKDPWNCVTMHQHGVVSHLLRLIGKLKDLLFFWAVYIQTIGIGNLERECRFRKSTGTNLLQLASFVFLGFKHSSFLLMGTLNMPGQL